MEGFDKRWRSVAKQASFSVPALVWVSDSETSVLTNSEYAKKMRRKRETKNAAAAEANDPPRSPTRKHQVLEGIVLHTHVGEAFGQRRRETATPAIPIHWSIASDGTITGFDPGSPGGDVTTFAVKLPVRKEACDVRTASGPALPGLRGGSHAPAEAPEFRREYLCGPYTPEESPRGAGGLPRR